MRSKNFNTIDNFILFENVEGFPGGSEIKVFACKAGDPGSIPGSGRSPGKGNGNPPQLPRKSMDRGVWQDTVRGVKKSWTQLSN